MWILKFVLLCGWSAYALAGSLEEKLVQEYAECDQLLVIVQPEQDISEFYQSADRVSKCKSKKYEAAYIGMQSKLDQ